MNWKRAEKQTKRKKSIWKNKKVKKMKWKYEFTISKHQRYWTGERLNTENVISNLSGNGFQSTCNLYHFTNFTSYLRQYSKCNFAGNFDPISSTHLLSIERANPVSSHLVVLVLHQSATILRITFSLCYLGVSFLRSVSFFSLPGETIQRISFTVQPSWGVTLPDSTFQLYSQNLLSQVNSVEKKMEITSMYLIILIFSRKVQRNEIKTKQANE